MKAIAWIRYFEQQRRNHRKTVFTTPELANIARASPAATNVMLARLVMYGVLERVARGIYAVPGTATLDEVLPQIDPGAYITGARVLFDAGFVTQSPEIALCFTDRRPFRKQRDTTVGRVVFRVVLPPVYAPPILGARTEPEQALLDLAWTAQGVSDLRAIYTFRNKRSFRKAVFHRMAASYPAETVERVQALLAWGPAR
jgi:hypothetical protein